MRQQKQTHQSEETHTNKIMTIMLHCLRAISFALILLLLNNLCKSEFRYCFTSRQYGMDDQFVPVRQLWSSEITSGSPQSSCAVSCMLNEACVSFFFNNQTNVCSGHSIILANLTHAEAQTGSTYYILHCRGK